MGQAAKAMSPSASLLQAALLDYYRAPGKYQLGCRQPELLFNAVRDVLQIATGRVEAVAGGGPEELREAAGFFIGAALLYPGADHYALLGVTPAADATELKERYRMLMRLVHPDFAGATRANWPKDSAMRVNRAYETLSSPLLRREYDDHISSGPMQHKSTVQQAGRRAVPAAKRSRPAGQRRFATRAAWCFVVVVSLFALGMLLPHGSPVRIVQKPGSAASHSPNRSLAPASVVRASEAAQPVVQQVPPTEPGQVPLDVGGLTESRVAAPVLNTPDGVPVTMGASIDSSISPTLVAPVEPALASTQPADKALPAGLSATLPPPSVEAVPLPAAPSPSAFGPNVGATRTVAVRRWAAPTLTDAQPFLTRLLLELESGNHEQILNLLDAEVRRTAGAQAFSRQYQRIVKGSRTVTLLHAEFRSEASDDVLIVVGDLRMSVGESTVGSFGEKLLVRAEFASRGGRVTLTGLSGVAE